MAPTPYVPPAPTTNLSHRFGVPLEPLQSDQPVGIAVVAPDHIMIPPEGTIPNPAGSETELALDALREPLDGIVTLPVKLPTMLFVNVFIPAID